MVGRLKFLLPALVALALAGPIPADATPLACLSLAGTGACATGTIDVTPGDVLSLDLILDPVGQAIDGYSFFTVDPLSYSTAVLSLTGATAVGLADPSGFFEFPDLSGSTYFGSFLLGASGWGSIINYSFTVIGTGSASVVLASLLEAGPVALHHEASGLEEAAVPGGSLSLSVNSQGGSASVPEPATFALIGLGLTGAALRLRSRRHGPVGR
jgi:hypothetical protein